VRVRVWDPATGTQTTQLNDHTDSVTSVAWSPDSTQLASASDDKTVRVWSTQGQQRASWPVGLQPREVTFGSDGARLAVAVDNTWIVLHLHEASG
jgi:WD40 repeat protein